MAKSKEESPADKAVCRNRRAYHDYHILEKLEAGLALTGSEVKSLRDGKASIEEAYGRLQDGEVWLIGADIPIYPQANRMNHVPKRPRKLLLHKREIARFAGRATQRGFTLIPLRLYFRRGYAKLELGIARGKKLYDKRQAMREKSAQKDIRRAMSGRR